MLYAAIALALVGFVVGVVFRFKVLLPILLLLLLVSIIFSVGRGFGFGDALLTVFVAQTIVQASYFLGLVARAVFSATDRMRQIL
jgi:ABC-type iron transport system FetAB permease component